MSDAYTLILRAINSLGAEHIKAARRGHPEVVGATDDAYRLLIQARDELHRARLIQPACHWCGRSMRSQRRRTCSDRCRMALSRSRAAAGSAGEPVKENDAQ